jgi:hypothetical protein
MEQMVGDAEAIVRRFRNSPNYCHMDFFRTKAWRSGSNARRTPGADGGESTVRFKAPQGRGVGQPPEALQHGGHVQLGQK